MKQEEATIQRKRNKNRRKEGGGKETDIHSLKKLIDFSGVAK
jgi:hypothetical protein